MVLNGHKWSKMVRYDIKWSNIVQMLSLCSSKWVRHNQVSWSSLNFNCFNITAMHHEVHNVHSSCLKEENILWQYGPYNKYFNLLLKKLEKYSFIAVNMIATIKIIQKRISFIRKGKCRPATTTTTTPSRSGDPPLDSETGWTGELWSKTNLLNWQK